MEQREKLTNLLLKIPKENRIKIFGISQGESYVKASYIADYLLENGAIVPPCKVGDTIFYIGYGIKDGKVEKVIRQEKVEMISTDGYEIYLHVPRALKVNVSDMGKRMFLSQKEAEKALERVKKR